MFAATTRPTLSIKPAALLACLLATSPTQAADWLTQNRSLSLALGTQQQAYRETDTANLTSDGALNRESGALAHANAALRWQFTHGMAMQISAARQNGASHYQGYLQSGGALTPYAARTGNIATHIAFQLGYALNASSTPLLPHQLQITPLLQLSQHHWQRNLVQYSETYRHTATAGGLRLQWQATERTVFEVQALAGRTQPAAVRVAAFAFTASQAGGTYRQWSIAAQQDLASLFSQPSLQGWQSELRYSRSHASHGASPMVGGVQSPPNSSKPSDFTLSLSRHF
jgi:hypothetical protein